MFRSTAFYSCSFVLLVTLAFVYMGMQVAGGHLFYPVDDTYIHLALAENLPWHYGLQSQSFASASSSILYPWLLLLGKPFGVLEFMPLLLNLLGLGLISFAMADLARYVPMLPSQLKSPLLRGLLLAFYVLAFNLMAIGLMGLEHTLHIASVLFILLGMVQLEKGERPNATFALALLLNPLLRYEGFALSLAVLGYLLWRGERTRPLLLFVGMSGIALLQGLYWHHLGLPFLPSSVLAKATHLDAGATWFEHAAHILTNPIDSIIKSPAAKITLALLTMLLLALPYNYRHRRSLLPLMLTAMAAMLAHLVFGKFDPAARYHVYMLLYGLGTVLLAYQPQPLAKRMLAPLEFGLLLGLLLAALLPHSYRMTLSIPLATGDVYLQQYQMHRFVRDYYQAPIVINDLGWVSYQLDVPVLDACGLGSENVRAQRAREWTTEIAAQLVAQSGAKLAMLYASYCIPGTPAQWQEVAQLTRLEKRAFGLMPTVTFYQTDSGDSSALRQQLENFAKTLPEGVKLTLTPAP